MIKKILNNTLVVFPLVLVCPTLFAATGNLFKITETGPPLKFDYTLCLNINGNQPLSCQNYKATRAILHIKTSAHHLYHAAGIKITSGGYKVKVNSAPALNYQVGVSNDSFATATGYISIGDVSDTTEATVTATSTTTASFVAVGSYVNASSDYCPLIASNLSNGSVGNWSYTLDTYSSTSTVLPADYNGAGEIQGADCADGICITVGNYFSTSTVNPSCPLIETSINSAASWSPTLDCTSSSLPLDLSGGSLSGASFGSSPYVVAVGGYNINSQDYPFIVTSSNSGASWETTLDSTLALPTNYSAAGGFVSASFSGTNFVAVGGYYATTGGGTNQPLIATSSSSTGDLWTYTFDGSYMPAGYSGGLSSASCTSSYCIAVGYSNDGNTLISYPLIVSATNTGASWSIILGTSSSTAGLPSDYHSNGVLDACFSGSTAFAVGSYSNSSYDIYPLIMTSTNSGDTWTSTLDSSNISSVLGPYYGQANLYGITCLSDTPTTCIAVGSYMSTSTTRYPFIVISTNSGSTWSNSTLTLPSDYDSTSSGFTNQQALLGITCSGSTCVAMGNYMSTNNSIVYPLIVTSTNSGGSWTSTLDSSTPSLPSGYSGYPNGLYY